MGHRSRRRNDFARKSKRRRYSDNERDASCIFPKEQELQTLHLDMPAYLVIADSGVTGNTKQAVQHVSTLQERIIDPTTQETGRMRFNRLVLSSMKRKRPSRNKTHKN